MSIAMYNIEKYRIVSIYIWTRR